jgi:hypothetical protein
MAEYVYTYQGGKKLPLSRLTTHFISRAAKHDLLCDRFEPIENVSPHSWTVRTSDDTIDDDIERARRIAPAYAAYVVGDTRRAFLVTDRVFVRLRTDADAHERAVRELCDKHRLGVVERLSDRDYLLRVPASIDVVEMVRTLTEREGDVVEIVDHDLNLQPQQHGFIIDPLTPLQWYLLSPPSRDALVASRALVDCEGAWAAAGQGSRDVVISVIDCGCDLTDPNFGDDKFAAWAILIDGELHSDAQLGVRRQTVMDPPRLHGTLCATLAAASANRVGGLGTAPACRLLPVKWQDLGGAQCFSQSMFCSIIRFLHDKVDVVSSSWNLGPDAYWPPAVSDCLMDAALHGGPRGNGIVWVWSAGNQNCPIQFSSEVNVPTRVSSRGDVLVVDESSTRFANSFVGIPGVLHVGAISSLGQRCHYSNYGTGLDLVAPSSNLHLYGRLNVSGVDLMVPLRSDLYPFGGTSACAPIVAGVAALVRSANPDLTARQIASILKRTADKDLDMSRYPRCDLPGDLPDAEWDVSPIPPFDSGTFREIADPDGTWSSWFGFGKVNARRAVEEALRCAEDRTRAAS